MRVERFRPVDDDVFELGVQFFEDGFREARADVADGFVGFGVGVVAGEEEGTVY